MGRRRKPDDPILQAMDAKLATRADFGPNASANAKYIDGREVSYEEWRQHRQEQERERAAKRVDSLFEDWDAEMDNRGILFDGVAPRTRTDKIPLVCGCARKQKFDANLYQLARLDRNRTCCPRCWDSEKPEKLRKVVEGKGGTLLTPYSSAHEHVQVQCANGHVFNATPANLTRGGGKDGSWCPNCNKKSGKAKLQEVLAERGCVLTDYGKYASTQKKGYVDHFGKEQQRDHSYLLQSPPIIAPKRGERPVRVFYDDDTMYAYALVGNVPPKLPKTIAEVVAKNDFEQVAVARTMGEATAALKKAIAADNEIGDYKVLNVLHNDEWVSPGVYTWGEIGQFDGTLIETESPGA
ncbi:hypothetical protein MAL1_00224 [Bacteriophage DSS3_MAL1]|nr:hypothetical protein MAL1_00224 [Bacteriophage DSS3_MAL1]